MITQDLGIATAYGYAKSKGYTGTEAEFAELMASYASTAQTAIEAADRAVEANTAAQSAKISAQSSASTASTAAQAATSKASEAVTAADTATTKASEASTSAGTASTAAQTATDKASIATTAAATATTKADEAEASATTASTAKTDAESARDAAAQSASEAAESAESIDPDEFNRKIYAAFATDTATGAIVSFPDGADSIPMKDVLVHVDPVQDLHGYDHPWSAGGGVNKFDIDNIKDVAGAYGLTTSIDGDIVRISGTYTGTIGGSAYRIIYHDQPIIEDAKFAIFRLDTNSAIISLRYGSTSDNSIVVGISDMTPNTDVDVRFRFMLYTGSTVPTSYTPYSNICPITGWTGVQIWDDPKYGRLINWNQKLKNPHFDEGTNGLQYWVSSNVSVSNLEDGSVLLTITAVHETQSYYNLFRQDLATITTKQHKFLILWDYKPAHTHDVAIFLIRSPGGSENYGQTINDVSAGKWNRLAYFISAQDRTFHQLQFALNATVNSGYSVGDVDYIRYPQMFDLTEMFGAGNEPTTLDEFKALFPKDCYDYNSEVTCVSAVSGEPHTHVQVSWQSEAGTVYGGTLDVTSGVLTVDRAIIASYAGEILPSTWISDRDVYSEGATPTTGAQVCYELATPITYQLTPQEITSLLGENNVWADTGNTEVEYRASTKMYIDKKITEAVSALS